MWSHFWNRDIYVVHISSWHVVSKCPLWELRSIINDRNEAGHATQLEKRIKRFKLCIIPGRGESDCHRRCANHRGELSTLQSRRSGCREPRETLRQTHTVPWTRPKHRYRLWSCRVKSIWHLHTEVCGWLNMAVAPSVSIWSEVSNEI